MAASGSSHLNLTIPSQHFTDSEGETVALGERFASHLGPGDVVALFGELGAGKTKFIQGVCSGLGVSRFVASPSFVLINEYRGRLPIYHFDFYRIRREEELLELGLDEYFYGQGVCLVEWAERVLRFLPDERIEVTIATCGVEQPTRRRITIERCAGKEPHAGTGH